MAINKATTPMAPTASYALTTDASSGYSGPFVLFVRGDLVVNGALLGQDLCVHR